MWRKKFMKRWIEEKIKYYERLLQESNDEKFKAEIEEGIKILKELL